MGAKTSFRTFYRELRYECGEYRDVYIFPVFQEYKDRKPAKPRSESKPTKATQERLNRQRSEEKHTRILHANFTPDDYEVGLSYETNPDSDERVKKDFHNFTKRVKRLMKKLGIKQELKYLVVPEKSLRGRYHLHVTISCGIDRDTLESLWGFGWANAKRLQFTETGLAKLANYKVGNNEKKPLFRKRWWGSRNLIDPKGKPYDYTIGSRRRAEELARDRDDRQMWEKLYPGYSLGSTKHTPNEINAGIYLFARLYKNDGKYITPTRKRKEAVIKHELG